MHTRCWMLDILILIPLDFIPWGKNWENQYWVLPTTPLFSKTFIAI